MSFPVQADDDGTRLVFDNDTAYNAVFVDGDIFDGTTVATAIADRLVYNSEILIMEGESYRKSPVVSGIKNDSDLTPCSISVSFKASDAWQGTAGFQPGN